MTLYLLFAISFVIFIKYVIGLIFNFGIPESISESAYLIKKNGKFKFYITMVAILLPLLIVWLQITPNSNTQFLIFISCAALGFVGVTGDYRLFKLSNSVHVISAMSCALLSQLWIIINMPIHIPFMLILFPIAVVLGMLLKGHRRSLITNEITTTDHSVIFWIECAAFISTYIIILTLLLQSK